MLGRLAIRLSTWAERYIPGALTIAVLLTLLAAARMDFRDILGYASLVFLAYAVVSVAFWLLPRLM